MEIHDALQLVESHLSVSLNDNERDLLKGALEGLDCTQIHKKYFGDRIQKAHLSRNVAPKLWKKLSHVFGEKVGMRNLRGAVERAQHRYDETTLTLEVSQPLSPKGSSTISEFPSTYPVNRTLPSPLMPPLSIQDWGDSPHVVNFCGRQGTLQRIETHIRLENCQVLTICGEAGVGKTWFAKKLAQQLMDQYPIVVWRSLTSHPPLPLNALLADWISAITHPIESQEPVSIAKLIDTLMEYPSLIILDDFENLLQAGVYDGRYREGYEDYGELLRQLGQRAHHSCILLISREKPREVSEMMGNPLTCSVNLTGFETLETQEFFQARGCNASPAHWRKLTQCCDGNPQALQLMDHPLTSICGGDLEMFLEVYEQAPAKIQDEQRAQFQRLSVLEQDILMAMTHLSPPIINLKVLKNMSLQASFIQCQQAQESLIRRSILKPQPGRPGHYTMASLMFEYIQSQLKNLATSNVATKVQV